MYKIISLSWNWFSCAGGSADIYFTVKISTGKNVQKDCILKQFDHKLLSYAQAEKLDDELRLKKIKLDGMYLSEMLKTYNRERMNGNSPKFSAEKAGIIQARMRAGWKKSLSKLPGELTVTEVFKHYGIEYGL